MWPGLVTTRNHDIRGESLPSPLWLQGRAKMRNEASAECVGEKAAIGAAFAEVERRG